MPTPQNEDKDRWRETLELLGLPPEEPEQPSARPDSADAEDDLEDDFDDGPRLDEELAEDDDVEEAFDEERGAARADSYEAAVVIVEEEGEFVPDLDEGPQDRALSEPIDLDEGVEDLDKPGPADE